VFLFGQNTSSIKIKTLEKEDYQGGENQMGEKVVNRNGEGLNSSKNFKLKCTGKHIGRNNSCKNNI
jgi:hypothetical protein